MSEVNRYQLSFEVEFVPEVNDVEKEIVLKNQHVRRGDITARMVRSTVVRKIYQKDANPVHDNHLVFKRGDIVIGNDLFGKYKNELQIVLEEHQDNRKNKVGQIIDDEHLLLDYIKPWSKFLFQ